MHWWKSVAQAAKESARYSGWFQLPAEAHSDGTAQWKRVWEGRGATCALKWHPEGICRFSFKVSPNKLTNSPTAASAWEWTRLPSLPVFPPHQHVMLIPLKQSSLHKSRCMASFKVKGKVKIGRTSEAQQSGLKDFFLLHLDNLSFSHSSSTKTLLAVTGCLSVQPCRCWIRKQRFLTGILCKVADAWLMGLGCCHFFLEF